jgi:hypothetical protein
VVALTKQWWAATPLASSGSSGAPAWTRCHPGRLGGSGAQFWGAPAWLKKAEGGVLDGFIGSSEERTRGGGSRLGAPCGGERGGGGGGSSGVARARAGGGFGVRQGARWAEAGGVGQAAVGD